MTLKSLILFFFVLVCVVAKPADRILGGSDSLRKSFPWVVLFLDTTQNSKPLCTGSLVTKTQVLTSSDCAQKMSCKDSPNSVCSGSLALFNALGQNSNDEGAVTFSVKSINVYPWTKSNYGIAIVQLNTDAGANPVTPVGTGYFTPVDVKGFHHGWGSDQAGSTLKKTGNVQALADNSVCSTYYNNDDLVETDQFMCFQNTGVASCPPMDSGAPFTTPSPALIGVHLGGINKCIAGAPIVAARLSYYNSWLRRNLKF